MNIMVTIKDLTSTGEGVASHEGVTLFVEGGLPGEKIKVAIVERKKSFAKAKIIEIIEPSKDRIDPICPVFDRCGGCQIMHAKYESQLKVKEKRIKDAMIRIGKLQNAQVKPCNPSPKSLHYRNKVQLPIREDRRLGLYAKRSHEIVPVEKCFIHDEKGEEIFHKCAKLISDSSITIYHEKSGKGELRHLLLKTAKETLVVLISTKKPSQELKRLAKEISTFNGVAGVLHGFNSRKTNVIHPESYTLLFGEDHLNLELLGIKVKLSPASFFQVNTKQAENIYQKAMEIAEIDESDHVLDAYCGIGLFACLLAKKAKVVTGVEIVEQAIKDAKSNAIANGVAVDFICGKSEDIIPTLPKQDVVFLNPPRKGCDEIVLEKVANMEPKKIVYTSCDPATLARDLRVLEERGYKNITIYPFDMFPQTMHVESLALLTK